MGGKSSSSSSNTNKTSYRSHTRTDTNTENTAVSGDVEEGALAVSGKGNHIRVIDGGAFDLGESVVGSIENTATRGFGMAEHIMSRAANLMEDLSEDQVQVMGRANELAQTSVANMASSNGADPVALQSDREKTKIYMSLAAAGAVAVVGASYFAGRKK